MKNVTKLTAFFLLFALAISSCKKDLQDLIENDLMFNMDANAFLQNQVQFQFVNANGANAAAPKASISIGGRDANLVFDINGGKNIQIEGQFAKVVVSPGKPLSAENPALFKVRAEAPGFLPYEQELAITQLDSFMTYTLEMVELKNAPEGIRYTATSNKIDGRIEVGDLPTDGFSVNVSMPADNAIIDAVGTRQPINKIELVQFDGNKKTITARMPNLIPNFTDKVNYMNTVEEASFFPLGYVQMNVNGRDDQLNFDKAANVTFNLTRGTMDPLTEQIVDAGDMMQVYQWDAANMNWKFLQETKLQPSPDGGLMAEATVNNTAILAIVPAPPPSSPISYNGPTCRSNLGIQFRRNSNVNTKHLVMVIAENDSSRVYAIVPNAIIANNTTLNISKRLPSNINLQVVVYEYEAFSFRGKQILVSQPFKGCNYTTSRRLVLNVNPPTKTNRKIARFELDTYCPTSRLFYYHEGRIEYRKAGDNSAPWVDLGLARRSGKTVTEIIQGVPNLPPVSTSSFSYLETDRLENGTTYEFRVTISGTPKRSRERGANNGTITKTFIKTRIFNESEFETLTGKSPSTYTYLKFKRSYWLANADDDQNPCSAWRY